MTNLLSKLALQQRCTLSQSVICSVSVVINLKKYSKWITLANRFAAFKSSAELLQIKRQQS